MLWILSSVVELIVTARHPRQKDLLFELSRHVGDADFKPYVARC